MIRHVNFLIRYSRKIVKIYGRRLVTTKTLIRVIKYSVLTKFLQKIEYLKEANEYSQKHIHHVEKRLALLEQTLHQFHQKITMQQQTIEKVQVAKQVSGPGSAYNGREGFEQSYEQQNFDQTQYQQNNSYSRDSINFATRPSPMPSLMTGSLSPSQGTGSSRYEDTPDQEYLHQFKKWYSLFM
jgi:hypothetical protein